MAWELIKIMLAAMWELWPLLALLAAIVGIRLVLEWIGVELDEIGQYLRFRKGEGEWRSRENLIKWMRGMDPSEFEEYTAWVFEGLGYKTKVVGKSHDGGIDVVATKDGVSHYIQCKKYFKNRSVGVAAVRDFYGAVVDELGDGGKGYFVTTSKFTNDAEKFARARPIELVGKTDLVKYIRMAAKESGGSYEAEENKLCPECDGHLILRKGKYGKFYGCSNYPDCHYTEQI